MKLPTALSTTFWFLTSILSACQLSGTTPAPTQAIHTISAISSPTATPKPASATPIPTTDIPAPIPTETPLAEISHQIGVRVVEGEGEFYDRLSGERFVPRGNNLVRVAWQEGIGGEQIFYHSNFNADLYDPEQTEQSLQEMEAAGYNVVRVFLTGACRDNCLGNPTGGLSQIYIANLADFLERAKSHRIFVLLTTDAEPGLGGYIELLDTTWSPDFEGYNTPYLRWGGILSAAQFWRDLIQALQRQGAPMEAIFAYELRNELFFEANLKPLSLTSGMVSTANGKSYDMASEEEKQRMMDEGLVFYLDQVREAIKDVDPTALVTAGFFVPQVPHPERVGDPRSINTSPAIWESQLDFIDLHAYPGFGTTLQAYVDNFNMAGMEAKPIILGEFGAAVSSYATAAKAARALHDWQVESCDFGFDGWLLWTWDTDEQTDFYNGLLAGGPIQQALAPASRPDPCQPGEFSFFETNLALGKETRASRSLPNLPTAYAVDGSTDNWWGSGNFPVQWIEIDLGEPATIKLFRLVTSQSPAGETHHQLWVGATRAELTRLYTFEGYTHDFSVLEYAPESPLEGIRFIQVATTKSPSWVSWREIEVIGVEDNATRPF
ncbi:MAG TPA: cellulase family glycosylhydrolase [Anaerolineales bacterium]|nr:cellulase family glycosylhydrolase [Anaerolineales bacterium]